MIDTVVAAVVVVGAVGLFVSGFSQVSGAAMRIVGPWFRRHAGTRTLSRFRRFMVGAGAGAGGSGVSAVVSLLSVVDGGYLPASRTIWILLGINLGGTAACWLVALAGYRAPLTYAALLLFAVSLPLRISPRLARYARPEVLTGLALLMLGVEFASGRLFPLPESAAFPWAVEALWHQALSHAALSHGGWLRAAYVPALGFAVGLVLSAVIRSSVGTVVLAMSLLARGWVPFTAAAAMALGSNVGVALTGFLASGGLGREARRTALIHLVLNGAACAWVAAAVLLLGSLGPTVLTVPADTTAMQLVPAYATPVAVALFHTLVHVGNPLVFLPLQNRVAALAERLVAHAPRKARTQNGPSLVLLPTGYPEALDANLARLQLGLARMAEHAYEMLMIVINASQVGDSAEQETARIVALRSSVKGLEEEIVGALTRSVQLPCSRPQAEQIQHQQRTAGQLSLVSDDCFKAMRLLTRSYRRNYRFHHESRDELFDFTSQILDFLKYNSDYLEGRIELPDPDVANRMEDRIDEVRDRLRLRVRRTLQQSADADIEAELAFIDIVRHLEHVGDRCLNIAESVRRMTSR